MSLNFLGMKLGWLTKKKNNTIQNPLNYNFLCVLLSKVCIFRKDQTEFWYYNINNMRTRNPSIRAFISCNLSCEVKCLFQYPHDQNVEHTTILILSRVSLAQESPRPANISRQPNPYWRNSWGFTSNRSKTCSTISDQSQHEFVKAIKKKRKPQQQ